MLSLLELIKNKYFIISISLVFAFFIYKHQINKNYKEGYNNGYNQSVKELNEKYEKSKIEIIKEKESLLKDNQDILKQYNELKIKNEDLNNSISKKEQIKKIIYLNNNKCELNKEQVKNINSLIKKGVN